MLSFGSLSQRIDAEPTQIVPRQWPASSDPVFGREWDSDFSNRGQPLPSGVRSPVLPAAFLAAGARDRRRTTAGYARDSGATRTITDNQRDREQQWPGFPGADFRRAVTQLATAGSPLDASSGSPAALRRNFALQLFDKLPKTNLLVGVVPGLSELVFADTSHHVPNCPSTLLRSFLEVPRQAR